MNCRKAKNQISLLVDGYLDARDHELLLEHIESCEKCRALYNDMQKTVSRLSNLEDVALPEGFENRMHFAFKREATEKQKSKFVKYSMIAMPAAAAVVAVVLGINFVLSGSSMKDAAPRSNMMAMDATEAEKPAQSKEESLAKGAMPQEAYGTTALDEGNTECTDMESDGQLDDMRFSLSITVGKLQNDDRTNTDYIDTAKSIVLSLGVDETSIVMSDDGECMTVAIPVEHYEEFIDEVKDNNFVIENEPANIDDLPIYDNCCFEVTFLFQK